MKRKSKVWALGAAALLFLWHAGQATAQSNSCPYNTPAGGCTIETRTDSTTPPTPDANNACTDGIDNDLNGYTDGADPHCQSEVLCQDGIDNDAGGGTDGADNDCMCLRQASGLPNAPCTAGDITVAYSALPIISDGCINTSDDTIVAQLTASVTAHQPQRYDIGMWMSLSGQGALDGSLCTRQILQEVGAPVDRLSGTGPYLNLDGDVCGDEITDQTSVYIFPFTASLPCTDQLPNGFVDIGQCGSWDNNDNTTCSNPTTALPGTNAKCRCERNESPIPGPNVLTVCTAFNSPSGLGGNGELDFGETASFSLAYTNTVANCTPGSPVSPDDYGRTRCGTASFVRFVIEYTGSADTRGTFTYFDGVSNVTVPDCSSPVVVPSNNGVLCNDTTNGVGYDGRLIWAPRDVNTSNTYGVISAFAGTQSLPFRYTLTDAVGTTPINFTARIYWDDVLDSPPTPANGITALEAVDLAGAILQNCTNCGCGTTLQTTPATLASFAAVEEGRGVRFDWSTATEVANLGFDLYAIAGGERFKLNREPIPSQSPDSLEPQAYRVSFAVPDGAEAFEVVDLDVRGRERRHGPFQLARRYGRPVDTAPVDWAGIRREQGIAPRGAGQELMRQAAQGTQRAVVGRVAAPVIDLLVEETGLYRVTYEDLLAAGFNLAGQQSAKLGLTSRGRPVPIYVDGNSTFGPGSYLEFYGEALDTIYTRTNVYQLRTKQSNPARARASRELPSGAATVTYPEQRVFERDLDYSVAATTPDPFYDTRLLVYSSPGAWAFDFQIDDLVVGSDGATMSADMYGGTALAAISPDHAVELELNGVPVGATTFDGFSDGSLELDLPADLLADGANQLVVRLPASTGAPYDLVYFDGFSVAYTRWLEAASGRLDFAGSGSRFEVGGLPDADVVAYRRDASGLTRLLEAVAVPDGAGFRAVVPGNGVEANYSVASAAGLLSPAAIRYSPSPAALLSGETDYLIISHSSFLGGLGDLIAARMAQGLSVKLVDVGDVYAAFGGGVYDPQAIRDYIAAAYASLGTRYVLLVGADTYDYFDHLGLGAVSFIPSPYVATGDIVRWAPSDSLYADVDGDGIQDLALGRLPVRTVDELAAVVAKTLEYDAKLYSATALLTADYTDGGANQPFSQASDRLRNELPASWAIGEAYLDELTLAQARAVLFSGFDLGTALVSYVGHSGFTHWGSPNLPASQHLFNLSDVHALTNEGRPAVVNQMGCWNTYIVSPRTESLGARFVLEANRGAAAATGAATLTEDANGNDFGVALAQRLATPGITLGEAWWRAKQDLAASSPAERDLRDVLLGWTILGDPALRVAP